MRERIAASQTSDDLSEAIEGFADVDIIRACGMVAAKQPLGVSLWRLKYAEDIKEYPAIVRGLQALTMKKGYSTAIIEPVLIHWISDVCPVCQGRGHAVIPNTPVLADQACGECSGTGRIVMSDTGEAVKWLQEQILRLEAEAAKAIITKLAG